MKILAFAATNHKQSINKQLIHFVASLLPNQFPHAEIEILDLNDYDLPLYGQDREAQDGIPQRAHDFYQKIGAADAVIVSFAEHNGGYTAVYKNLFDWASRINQKIYQDKPMMIMATSPGPRGGLGVLTTAEMGAPYFGMNVKAKISVPTFFDNFDVGTGRITNDSIHQEIDKAIALLK